MANNFDPREDYIFKRLFGNEDQALVLVALLNAVLDFPPGRVVRGVTLLNPFVARDSAESKVPILDVRARDDPGRLFLVEMQRLVRESFAKRALYYWSMGHAAQLFKGDSYEMLHPTYFISFLDETLFEDEPSYHHCFHIRDAKQGRLLCKDLEIHLLELTKFNVLVEEVKTPLERWCYFLKHGASLDQATLPATLDDPQIRQALEVLMRVSRDEMERQRAMERQKMENDAAALVADARRAHERLLAAEEKLRVKEEQARIAEEQARTAQEQARTAQEQARTAQEQARAAEQAAFEKGERIGRIQLLRQLLRLPEMSREELNRVPEPELVQMEELMKRQLSGPKPPNGTPPSDPT
jgi:predicted transposase/invertase (TIGR01784 family)